MKTKFILGGRPSKEWGIGATILYPRMRKIKASVSGIESKLIAEGGKG